MWRGYDVLWAELQDNLSGRRTLESSSSTMLWSVPEWTNEHKYNHVSAPCIVPYMSNGHVVDRDIGTTVGHNQSVSVTCVTQFQPSHNSSVVCNNGTWTNVARCVPAKCTELPDAPRNGMVVAPNLDHGMVGKFECRDGYLLKGNNTTQCYFGNWTGMTPWCKEGCQ